MDKAALCREYLAIAENLAEIFSDRDVPSSVQSFYLLCELIASGSIESFASTYGHHPIDVEFATEGKARLNLGKLTDFEIAAAKYFNTIIEVQT